MPLKSTFNILHFHFSRTINQFAPNNSIDSEIPYVNFETPITAIGLSDSKEELIEEWGERDEPSLLPCGDKTHTINLGTEEIKRELKVVENGELESMVSLLKEFLDVFSWSYDDMLGLDP